MSAERLLEKEFKGDVKVMRSSGEHVTGELKKKGVEVIEVDGQKKPVQVFEAIMKYLKT